MQKYKIPEDNRDLKRYAAVKHTKYLCFYLLYVAFFSLAFLFFLERRSDHAEQLSVWVYVLFCLTVLISGWFVCCMNRFVKDRYACGIIIDMKYLRDYGRGLDRTAGLSVDFHSYINITICDEKGKKKNVKVPLFADGFDGYYKEGKLLVKFRGLNYPVVKERLEEGLLMCTVCGARNSARGERSNLKTEPIRAGEKYFCGTCGRSLIEIL